MKNSLYFFFLIILILPILLKAQTVIGRLVDENGAALAEVQLQLYASQYVYDATSGSDGSFSFNNITGVEDNQLPTGYIVSDNFPNPFNPTTKIKFEIPGQVRNDNMLVTLKVFDILGNEIATLVNEEKPTGTYELNWNAANLPSGVYFYRLQAGSFVQTQKMILLK